MGQITVMVAGKSYRIACADGEEGHLDGLAKAFDAKLSELRTAFGEIGDMRLHVMGALTYADELSEARQRIVALEADIDRHVLASDAEAARGSGVVTTIVTAVEEAAHRIEQIAQGLGAASRPGTARGTDH